jgi:hypothetical protein
MSSAASITTSVRVSIHLFCRLSSHIPLRTCYSGITARPKILKKSKDDKEKLVKTKASGKKGKTEKKTKKVETPK